MIFSTACMFVDKRRRKRGKKDSIYYIVLEVIMH